MSADEILAKVKFHGRRFISFLFGNLTYKEGLGIIFCIAIQVYLIVHLLDPRYDGTNKINLMSLGLIFVSLILGLSKSVSARFWAFFFFFISVILWVASVYYGNPGGWTAFSNLLT